MTGERVRTLASAPGTVTLVGSVHDHPASAHRAATVVDRVDPAVLALELPPIALPLFEGYAATEATVRATADAAPPPPGGEMTAAIGAAGTDRIVGIDGPSPSFMAALTGALLRERPPLATVTDVFAGVRSAGAEALRCRLAAMVDPIGSAFLDGLDAVDHDCAPSDPPTVQAADEDTQIARARAVMDTFEPSRAAQFRDATREAHMADRLAALRREGDVVAVVGYGHVDALADRLRDGE